MKMDEERIVRIKLEEGTRELLKQYGIKNETYDTIIRRFMERWPEGRRVLEEKQ